MSFKTATAPKPSPRAAPPSATSLPRPRRRRESSEDFGASASLGSIGGSAFGSSVETTKLRTSSLELSIASKGSATVPAGGDSTNTTASTNVSPKPSFKNNYNDKLPASATSSTTSSPNGRKPFRKRKGSVDFTLTIDEDNNDVDSNTNTTPKQPQHASTTAAAASPAPTSAILVPTNFSTTKTRSRNNSDATGDSALSSTNKLLPSVDALPSIEALPNIDDASLLLNPPTSPAGNSLNVNNSTQNSITATSNNKDRALSFGSSKTEGRGVDQLDVVGGTEATISASKIRKNSISERSNKSQDTAGEGSNTSSHGTLTSQSQKFLLEALLGDGTESLVLNPSQRERLGSFDAITSLQRERLGSFDAAAAIGSGGSGRGGGGGGGGLSHNSNDNNPSASSRDRLGVLGGRRDRLESWGGMSDLSATGLQDQNSDALGSGGTSTAAALAATMFTSLANDVSAAAGIDENESVSSFLANDELIPSKISLNRDRLNSVASMATEPSALFYGAGSGGSAAATAGAEDDIPADVHRYVQAAMASVEDQLADLANSVEEAARERDMESEVSSTASPMIGAASDIGSNKSGSITGRPRSSSVGSALNIAVDYDAVAAAVDAAEAAAGALDLTSFAKNASESKLPPQIASAVQNNTSSKSKNRRQRPLPLQKARSNNTEDGKPSANMLKRKTPPPPFTGSSAKHEILPIPKSQLDEEEMERIRERARAAAGYVPPSSLPTGNMSLPPKKRAKLYEASMEDSTIKPPITTSSTPLMSNKSVSKYQGYNQSTQSTFVPKGQASQKWESMFESLVDFIDERKKEETKGMSETRKKEWTWDGNVPTSYKTKDGKALGRWVNNQRSAKSKGTLKEEREVRLVNAGLKWSVLSSNSWNEMLEELRIYVDEQVKQGKEWDGNVPTNYKIPASKGKSRFYNDDDEDRNLGRWVNRQRSMYSAGKLRKDRQFALEKLGLKWSMLATTSWDSMFDTLCEYVEEKTKGGAEWDGNVPANYKTTDDPPRALGRWINRQRSSYGKKKLKPECITKLNKLGLRWSVHERRPCCQYSARPDTVSSTTTNGFSGGTNGDADKNPSAEEDQQKDEDIRPDDVGSSEVTNGGQNAGAEVSNADKSSEGDGPANVSTESASSEVQTAFAVSI